MGSASLKGVQEVLKVAKGVPILLIAYLYIRIYVFSPGPTHAKIYTEGDKWS